MQEINTIIGKNLMLLRKNAKLTQLEFAEKFNYSDKSISKWENGESLPSVDVLYEVAKFYNTTLDALTKEDDILQTQTPSKTKKERKPRMFPTHLIVTLLSVCAVWLFATITFVVLKLTININYGMVFLWALPLSCVLLIIFNSFWGRMRYLFPILTVFLWVLLACLHIQLLLVGLNIWPIYFLGIPLQVAIILWGALIKKPSKKQKEKHESKNKKSEDAKQNITNEKTDA
ncbi:MAG: helix-turn-helix transcriptional regulator [Clostridia bacterium]|nr:helix-turn-helix transcriptional regulator [Clostridia bacterium]